MKRYFRGDIVENTINRKQYFVLRDALDCDQYRAKEWVEVDAPYHQNGAVYPTTWIHRPALRIIRRPVINHIKAFFRP